MDAFDISGGDDLLGERPPADAGFDSFIFEDPSFIEDELQNISEEPDVCQPAGHVIMVSNALMVIQTMHSVFTASLIAICPRKSKGRCL